jgi:hypothetical protein
MLGHGCFGPRVTACRVGQGADKNHVDSHGITPEGMAKELGHTELATFLAQD